MPDLVTVGIPVHKPKEFEHPKVGKDDDANDKQPKRNAAIS